MAYTTTSLSNSATLVGTSGADTVTSAVTEDIQVSSFEGTDSLTLTGGVDSGSVGMGGGIDTVNITTAASKKLNITLGDSADNFDSDQVDNGITVGGQGGADTFILDAASINSRYGGGQGKDIFKGTANGGTLGVDSSIVGGSEDDTIGLATSGLVVAARVFINGNAGADTIYVNNAAAATVRGGSENDTITVQAGGADGSEFYGDKGNDKITDLTGDSKLFGGEGNDTLIGGQGVDEYTGGAGSDLFDVTDTFGGALELTTIKDFTVADSDTISGFSVTDVEQGAPADLISVGNAATSLAAGTAVKIESVSGATIMDGTSGNVLVASSAVAFTNATFVDALENNGSLELEFNGALAANDGFLAVYDNNVDTFIVAVRTGAIIANNANAAAGNLSATTLVKLDGITDASTITAAMIGDFIA